MRALSILIFVAVVSLAKAQTWDETFNQKETQKKYLIQQLAALKMYAAYLKKGYEVADRGLKTIKEFTNGEFNLHSDFIKSLKVVNPAVAGNPKIIDILKWQSAIIKGYTTLRREVVENSDRNYFESVRAKVLSESQQDIDELLLVITSGKLELKDDERLKRIDMLHARMLDKYEFTNSFLSQLKMLKTQREQDERNAKNVNQLHKISN
jgi:hypothetical protein